MHVWFIILIRCVLFGHSLIVVYYSLLNVSQSLHSSPKQWNVAVTIYTLQFFSYLAPFSWSRFTGVNSSSEPLDDFLLLFFWWCLWGFRTFTVIGGRSIPYACSFLHFPCRWRTMETTITRTNTPNVTAIAIMLVFTELAGWGGSQVWCLKTSL